MRRAGLTAAGCAIPQAAAPPKPPGAIDSRGASVGEGASADDVKVAGSLPGLLSKSQKKRQKERLRKEAEAGAERQGEAGMLAGSIASTTVPSYTLPASHVQLSGSDARDASRQATRAAAATPPVGAVSGGTMAVSHQSIVDTVHAGIARLNGAADSKGSQAGTVAMPVSSI